MDKNSQVLRHLDSSPSCKDVSDEACFTLLDNASSNYQLKIKEALHINWERLYLNTQVTNASITLSL